MTGNNPLWTSGSAYAPSLVSASGDQNLVLHPVPEPASMLLMGAGLLSLGGIGRLRHRIVASRAVKRV